MLKRIAFALSLSCLVGAASADPEFWRHEWPKTNFEKSSVENWVEILSGGPPKDGIPALNAPKFQKASAGPQCRLSGQTNDAYLCRSLG